MMYLILSLPWFAAFTSQSLLDISDVLIVGCAFFMAFKKGEIKKIFVGLPQIWLWIVWLSVIVVGITVNEQWLNKEVVLGLLEYRWIFSFLCAVYLYKEIISEKLVIQYLAPMVLFLNIMAIGFYFYNTSDRAGGIYNQVMSFSHNIAPTCVFFLFYLLTAWNSLNLKHKILISTVVASSGVLTLLTLTRGVWLGVFVSILFSIYIWRKKFFFATAVISIVSFGLFVGLNKNVQDRIIVNEQTAQTGSNYLRIALLKVNLNIAADNPVFGVGIGQNKRVMPQYLEKLGYPKFLIESHAHNQFLEFLANTGFLGLICFCLFYFFTLRAGYRSFFASNDQATKTASLALLAGIVCFIVGSLTECNFNISKNRFFFILLAAWAVSLAFKQKNTSNNV